MMLWVKMTPTVLLVLKGKRKCKFNVAHKKTFKKSLSYNCCFCCWRFGNAMIQCMFKRANVFFSVQICVCSHKEIW